MLTIQRTDLATADEATLLPLVKILGTLGPLQRVDEALLYSLVRRATLVHLPRGGILIRQGEEESELYVLLDGVIRVESGTRLILELDRTGDVVGELAALKGSPRLTDVVGHTHSRLIEIKPGLLKEPELASLAQPFFEMLTQNMASKLRDTTRQSLRLLDRAEEEANTDSLTGLANRKRLDPFLASLERQAATLGEPFSLIIADVDHFKIYNDSNGHQSGDRVLVEVARLLKQHVRKHDLVCRFGGEEFVVVLPDCTEARALEVAEALREAIAGGDFSNGASQPLGRVTATFGVASYPQEPDAHEVLRRADQRLYHGKQIGRNRVIGSAPAARP